MTDRCLVTKVEPTLDDALRILGYSYASCCLALDRGNELFAVIQELRKERDALLAEVEDLKQTLDVAEDRELDLKIAALVNKVGSHCLEREDVIQAFQRIVSERDVAREQANDLRAKLNAVLDGAKVDG